MPAKPQPKDKGVGVGGGRGVHEAICSHSSQCSVEIHGYQHHRELEEKAVWLGALQPYTHIPPNHRFPASHCPHQDGKSKPRDAPRVAVDGMANVFETALGTGKMRV